MRPLPTGSSTMNQYSGIQRVRFCEASFGEVLDDQSNVLQSCETEYAMTIDAPARSYGCQYMALEEPNYTIDLAALIVESGPARKRRPIASCAMTR